MNKPENFDRETLFPVTFHPDNGCNTKDDVLLDQVAANIRRQLPQAYPHQPNGETVALVCGGPSLLKTEKELVKLQWGGAKVVAVNGAYKWCVERNIKPSAMVMLDARQFNSRFVEPAVDGCRYLLSSQCHPDAFDLCHGRDVTIWHTCSAGQEEYNMLADYYFKRCLPVINGTTVAIRSIALLRMLGFQSFEIFGLDSCWMGDEHHAYAQPENNRDGRLPVWLRPEGRDDLACRFEAAPWQMQQCVDFQKLIHEQGNTFRLNVHGDGLIAAVMRLSALLGSTVTPEPETKPEGE